MNALAAIAVCDQCGMTMKEAAEGLQSFTGFKDASRFTPEKN